ncbi:peptide ABC transporter substrate-binding protein [Planctomycetales bacterium]|nr:peptide ABC transporter substrate-binding protein [Planctomycetales bacterium]GHT36170.1 peptide ABC transporter substrate-binding protein [Planctomycetales bacterium]
MKNTGNVVLVFIITAIYTLFIAAGGFAQPVVPDNADGSSIIEEQPLFLKAPRNRLTLTSHYNSISFLIEPLVFAGGVRPNPLPRFDDLTVTFLDNPDKTYTVKWNFVEKIGLFYELVFEEFQNVLKQTTEDVKNADIDNEKERKSLSGKFELLFDYLNYLNVYKKDLPGFNNQYNAFLLLEAQYQLKTGNGASALLKFAKLLEENQSNKNLNGNDLIPLASAALDSVIKKEYAAKEFAKCRTYLNLFAKTLPQDTVFLQWKDKIRQAALEFLKLSEKCLSEKQYVSAHLHNQSALSIDSESEEVLNRHKTLQKKAPLFRIAVNTAIPAMNTENPQEKNNAAPFSLPDEGLQRYRRLCGQMFLRFVKPSLEGGVYQNPYIKTTRSEDGLSLSFQTKEQRWLNALADTTAQLSKTNGNKANGENLFAGLFASASVNSVSVKPAEQAQADTLTVKFKRRFPLPEALFEVPLNTDNSKNGFQTKSADGGLYLLVKQEGNDYYFQANNYAGIGPAVINETLIFRSEEAAAVLKDGKVDIINKVAPWEIESLKHRQGITVKRYAVPNVHFIIPNVHKPLTADKTFRRALVLGLNRQAMLGRILNVNPAKISERFTNSTIASNGIDGAVSSVPFIRGSSLGDPLGYGNDTMLRPRQYEPKLAAALALSVFNRLRSSAEYSGAEYSEKEGEVLTSMPVLVLSCPADDAAKYAALLIKHQWSAIGVPVRIAERQNDSNIGSDDADFYLIERTVKEPLTEAELIFGKNGLCRDASPAMELALEKLRNAGNWSEASKVLFEIHRICYEETTVIPLWQVYNYYAYRSDIKGLSSEDSIIDLYENVKQWR